MVLCTAWWGHGRTADEEGRKCNQQNDPRLQTADPSIQRRRVDSSFALDKHAVDCER